MNRLRHPVRAIREPFGTAGLVVACVALVLALTGAAFAAAGLTGKQKKEVEKIAKKYAGKPGASGPAGPAGPQGPAGAKGDNGAKGDQGNAGSPGKSVKVTEVSCGGLGGAEVKQEGAGSGVEVCNGEEGAQGPKGDPWTLGGTLPPKATETGTWSFNATAEMGENISAEIGFPIKLESRLESAEVHFQPPESADESVKQEFKSFCPNSVVNPTAVPGHLCVYYNQNGNGLINAALKEIHVPYTIEEIGTGVNGAILRFEFNGGPGEETASGFGSWAVTAPAEAP